MDIIKKKYIRDRRQIPVHITSWLLFIAYELSLVYFALGKLEKAYVYLIYYPIHIAFFYACVQILRVSFDSPISYYLKGAIKYLALLVFYLLLKFCASYLLKDLNYPVNNANVYIQNVFLRNLGRGVYFTILATLYWSAGYVSLARSRTLEAVNQKLKIEKENAELETALTKAQSAYRQQQLNPHMLFNTLNFIYNNVQKHSDEAARCVWLLAEIMRFSLDSTGNDGKVKLESEAEQIENLLEINTYRFQHPLYVDISMEGNFQQYRIIPLIVLTLVENVFKHGDLTAADHPAMISLRVNEHGQLAFFTRNLKKAQTSERRNQQVGLQNVRIRLDTEYKDRYLLKVAEPDNEFELTLTMDL